MPETAVPAAPDLGPRPELTWLPVDRLDVDQAYQRSLEASRSRQLIARIAENFRWAAFQAILASPAASAADRWLIIDGQHRVAAARRIGLSLVPSVVIHGADRQDQARAFVGANRDRVPVSAQALFHARVAAGDADAIALQRLCRRAGIEITRYSVGAAHAPAGKTTAASALLRLVREVGEETAGSAIAAVAACYGKERGGLRAPFFLAAARYLSEGGNADELRRALAELGWRELEAAAYGMGGKTAVTDLVAKLRAAVYPSRARVGAAAPAPMVQRQANESGGGGLASPPERAFPFAEVRGLADAPMASVPDLPKSPPLKTGPLPPAGSRGFRDDHRAKRDHGSPRGIGAPMAPGLMRSTLGDV